MHSTTLKRILRALGIWTLLASHPNGSFANEPWAGFQGPPDNLVADNFPLHWSATDHIAWKADLPGYGQSSPVISKQMVIVTSVSGPMKEKGHILAFQSSSGEKLWQYDLNSASEAKNNNYISRAAPTPAIDSEQIAILFETGNLLSLNHAGKPRWHRNLVKDYGEIQAKFGIAASLEHNNDHIFVWIERENDPYVMAVAKKDGRTLWKSPGLHVTSWSSPRLIPVGEEHHLVLSGIGKLAGYDPKTGKRLWTLEDISGNSTPTPIPIGNGRFLIAATTGRSGGGSDKAARSNGLVEIKKNPDGQFQAAFIWRAKRATSSFGSPLAIQNNAYFVNRQGVVYCLDLQDGQEKYAKRTADSVWATPFAVGEQLYFFGKKGVTTVVKAGDEFELLAENPLFESRTPDPASVKTEGEKNTAPSPPRKAAILYAAAGEGSRLFLRTGETLYCVQP